MFFSRPKISKKQKTKPDIARTPNFNFSILKSERSCQKADRQTKPSLLRIS